MLLSYAANALQEGLDATDEAEAANLGRLPPPASTNWTRMDTMEQLPLTFTRRG